MDVRCITAFCASSSRCDPLFLDAAHQLGALLARSGVRLVTGGGAVGLMGALARGALEAGGEVTGIIPEFMVEREWGHDGLTELVVVETMHERKQRMYDRADALVALPGGCGTLEELLEAITWKRLGLHGKPIGILNVAGFYDPLLAQLEACVSGRFMEERHRELWIAVPEVAGVLPALRAAPARDDESRGLATL